MCLCCSNTHKRFRRITVSIFEQIHWLVSIIKYIGYFCWFVSTRRVATKNIITNSNVLYRLDRPVSHTYQSTLMQTAYTSLRKRLDEGLHGIQRHVASYSRQLAVFLDA